MLANRVAKTVLSSSRYLVPAPGASPAAWSTDSDGAGSFLASADVSSPPHPARRERARTAAVITVSKRFMATKPTCEPGLRTNARRPRLPHAKRPYQDQLPEFRVSWWVARYSVRPRRSVVR